MRLPALVFPVFSLCLPLCVGLLGACNEAPGAPKVAESKGLEAPRITAAELPVMPSSMPGEADAAAAVRATAPVPSAATTPPHAAPSSSGAKVAVDVANIGLHIGGGPNDDASKAPLIRSVEPHIPAFRACFAKADDLQKRGDFGVDLLVEREGGHAKVTNPRTGIAGDAFRACVLDVFEQVEFQRPKTGKTMASYSLRFTPRP